MRITIDGGVYNNAAISDMWASIERIISAMSGASDTGRLIRISRRDAGANYRDRGTYDLFYVADNGFSICVTLELR